MKATKIQTNKDTIVHFILIPIEAEYYFVDMPHHSNNTERIGWTKEDKKIYIDKSICTFLGEFDNLQDNDILYHVQILPDGVFKNYDLNTNGFPETFNSPLASLKSALHQTKLHLEMLTLNKILVIVEKIF